jgi:uncharacterized membrane protein YfcA
MIDPWAFPALTAVAVLTGFIDAIAGGGGLIMMPALLFAGLSPIQALATNKLQSVFGTCVAMANFGRKGLIDWKASRWAVLVVFVGAAAGVLLVQALDASVLNLIVPVLLVFAAGYILLSPRMSDEDAQHRLGERGYAPVAGAVGFYDGFFGPGAGTLYTTSLVALRGLGLTRATAHAKLFNFTSNVASVLLFALGGKMMWLLGLCMAAGAMAGGWIGSHTAMRFGARLIRPLLVTISLGMTARLLWGYFGG